MLMIPGLALMNAVRDVLAGEYDLRRHAAHGEPHLDRSAGVWIYGGNLDDILICMPY